MYLEYITLAIGDFESASRDVVVLVFGDLLNFMIRYCVFHFAQCNVRQIGFKGLLKQFKRKTKGKFTNHFYKWAKLVFALPFLPAHLIPQAWDDLCKIEFDYFGYADKINLKRYKVYFKKQWITNPNIDHKELSVFGAENATNNHHESFNKILNDEFDRKAPNVWDFLLGKKY